MDKEIRLLREDLEKMRSQFYIFYELTKALRTTLRLDEIVYAILTGLTAHQGLAFNRAMLFLVDEKSEMINGFMGIGPIDIKEADAIWSHIEQEQKTLYDLIKTYHRIKEGHLMPDFLKFIQSLSFPLNAKSGLVFNILSKREPLHIKKEEAAKLKNDPLVQKLQLKEFLLSPVWIKNKAKGIILVDNNITGKPMTDDAIKIFNMFVDQAAGAIENSQEFENTLLQAHTDPLTDLWNHGYFQYRLDEELAKAKAEKYSFSVVMIDVDNFKLFNDTYGHVQGDNALKIISASLKDICRKADILCRYGGEEFSLILPFTNKEESFFIGERIRLIFMEKVKVLEKSFTISIGLSSFPHDGSDKETLIKKADNALYQAKHKGKNTVVIA